MLGGPGPAWVEDAGPDPPQLRPPALLPALLPALDAPEICLAEEDEAVVGEVADTVGGGEESEGGEEAAATHKPHLLSPGLDGAQGGGPGLAGRGRPLSTDDTSSLNNTARPRADHGDDLSWVSLISLGVEGEDSTPGTWLWCWRCGRSCEIC